MNIQKEASALLDRGATLIALSGDHSISLPLLRAHHAKYGPLSLIRFDAHPDTWPSEYGGRPYSHGTPFRRAIEEQLVRPGYIQVGVRGPTTAAGDLAEARRLGARIVTLDEALALGMPRVVEAIRETVHAPIYLTLDIDSVDPAFAPGTGTPEVGGFTSHQLLSLVRGLAGLEVVGFALWRSPRRMTPPESPPSWRRIWSLKCCPWWRSGGARRKRVDEDTASGRAAGGRRPPIPPSAPGLARAGDVAPRPG